MTNHIGAAKHACFKHTITQAARDRCFRFDRISLRNDALQGREGSMKWNFE
jgi:hypothetical protein